MISLESETRTFLKSKFDIIQDNTRNQDLDFFITIEKKSFFVEAKEKRQKYNINNWKTSIPQEHLFILDDVSARKCFFAGPYGIILIRDNTKNDYYVLDMITLFFMKKERANRKIEGGELRGKIFVDLRQCAKINQLEDIEQYIKTYAHTNFTIDQECYTPFEETIQIQGIERLKSNQKHDFFATR